MKVFALAFIVGAVLTNVSADLHLVPKLMLAAAKPLVIGTKLAATAAVPAVLGTKLVAAALAPAVLGTKLALLPLKGLALKKGLVIAGATAVGKTAFAGGMGTAIAAKSVTAKLNSPRSMKFYQRFDSSPSVSYMAPLPSTSIHVLPASPVQWTQQTFSTVPSFVSNEVFPRYATASSPVIQPTMVFPVQSNNFVNLPNGLLHFLTKVQQRKIIAESQRADFREAHMRYHRQRHEAHIGRHVENLQVLTNLQSL